MDTIIKIGFSLISAVVAGIPTWIWLLARNVLEPEGFWQEVVVLGLGVWILGGLQVLAFICLIGWLAAVVWGQ